MKFKIKHSFILFVWICITMLFISNCRGQNAFGTKYLELQKTIPLSNVKGRIDHLAINLKDRIVYISALGNNTLEVVDLHTGKLIHSITGLNEPQGVGYIPQSDELFVANGGNGECYFYNARTFSKIANIRLSADADDVSYDSTSRKIYVGYGEGGIAVIDADTHRKIKAYLLPAHPERFQIDKESQKIYVNVPDADRIDVIGIKQGKTIKVWKNSLLSLPKFNFPMALDSVHHRLFIGYRLPARLVVLDSQNGGKIATGKISGDPDDMFYDYQLGRIYVSNGAGSIDIFKQENANAYRKIANIPTRHGSRTSLLIPELHLYLLAEPATGNKQARVLVFKTN